MFTASIHFIMKRIIQPFWVCRAEWGSECRVPWVSGPGLGWCCQCECWVWVRKLKVRTVVRGPWLVAGGDSSYLPPARGPAPGKIGLVSSWARGVRRDPCSRETHPCFIHTQLSTSRILLRPWWSPSESGTGWASLLLQKVSQLGNFQETLWRCYGWWLVRLKRWCDAGWAAWLPGVRSFDASDVVNSWDCHHSHSIVLLRAARQQSEIINWATG